MHGLGEVFSDSLLAGPQGRCPEQDLETLLGRKQMAHMADLRVGLGFKTEARLSPGQFFPERHADLTRVAYRQAPNHFGLGLFFSAISSAYNRLFGDARREGAAGVSTTDLLHFAVREACSHLETGAGLPTKTPVLFLKPLSHATRAIVVSFFFPAGLMSIQGIVSLLFGVPVRQELCLAHQSTRYMHMLRCTCFG